MQQKHSRTVIVMPFSYHRHKQDKTVLSYPCQLCELNWRQDKTVLSRLDPVSNLQKFSLKYIEDYWKLSWLVANWVHSTDTNKTMSALWTRYKTECRSIMMLLTCTNIGQFSVTMVWCFVHFGISLHILLMFVAWLSLCQKPCAYDVVKQVTTSSMIHPPTVNHVLLERVPPRKARPVVIRAPTVPRVRRVARRRRNASLGLNI